MVHCLNKESDTGWGGGTSYEGDKKKTMKPQLKKMAITTTITKKKNKEKK